MVISSVEEIRQALVLAGQKGREVAGVVRHGVLELEQLDALLVNAARGSVNETYSHSAARFIEACRLLEQAQDLLRDGDESLSEYLNRL